jgi:DNA-binding NarL/FixJ family response regulator
VGLKTVLLVDDEQAFLEPLDDALTFEGYRVLKARDVSAALEILQNERIDLVSVDIMLSPGARLEGVVDSQRAGVYLCEWVSKEYPRLDAFCISVVSDHATIRQIERCGFQFIGKGETSLRTVIEMMKAKLRGVPYSPPEIRRRY